MALDVGAPLIAALMLAGGGLGSTIVRFTITADGMGPIVVADLSADEVGTLVAVSGCTSSRGRRAMRCPSGDGR